MSNNWVNANLQMYWMRDSNLEWSASDLLYDLVIPLPSIRQRY